MRKMLSRNQTIELVNEAIESGEIHCDPSTEVKVGDINSESATAGKVIVADGDGGAEWGEVSGGLEVITLTYGTALTEEQYTKAQNGQCVLMYDNNTYIKSKVSGQMFFYSPMLFGFNGSFYQSAIRVFSGGTWTKVEYEVDTNAKAYEGTSLLPTDVVFESWTLHRAIKDGNILWLVCSGKIHNNSASQQSVDYLFELTIPSNIGSHIYRMDGTTVNNTRTGSDSLILQGNGAWGSTPLTISVESPSENYIKIGFNSTQTINASGNRAVNLRIPIFLNIGTV